jgi:hypothetical protein
LERFSDTVLHRGSFECVDKYIYALVDFRDMSTTIRVSEETRDRLASLANTTGRPMTRVVDDAVEALERKVFFDTFNRRYQELRDDPAMWSEIEQQRRAEEGALGDLSE